ncbi:MAG: caspase family protein [Desulfobacterales bacterium]
MSPKSKIDLAGKRTVIRLWICFALCVVVFGCVLAPAVVPPESAPEYVRRIAYHRVYNYHRRLDTGIDLVKDQYVSIMATGKFIHRWRSDLSKNAAYYLLMFVDDHYTRFFFSPDYCGGTFVSKKNGKLYLGIDRYIVSPDYTGHFDVTVIVWGTEDPSTISDYLKQLNQKAPDHIGIKHAATQAHAHNEIAKWKAEISKEIEAAEAQIETLQKPESDQGESASNQRAQRLEVLQEHLLKLSARLAELQATPVALQVEREKTSDLNRRLEEMRRREEELMQTLRQGQRRAPLLIVSAPEDNSEIEFGRVHLRGYAEDDVGLELFEVRINDRIVHAEKEWGTATGAERVFRRLPFDRIIKISPGTNRLTVKVANTSGHAAEKTLTVHHAPSQSHAWAVVVGINDYPNLSKLKYAVNDAREFYNFLMDRNRIPSENVMLLLEEKADLKNIRKAFGTHLKSHAGENDLVIIFFAGHGSTERDSKSPDQDGLEKYLLPHDTEPRDLYSSAIPMREIAYIFERIRSQRLIFIADACYSGASGGRTASDGGLRATLSDTFLDRLAGGRGKVIITASAANEVSVEKDELQHGVFT